MQNIIYPSELLSSRLESVLVMNPDLWETLVSASGWVAGDLAAVLNTLMFFFVQAMAADNSDNWFAAKKMKKASA